MILPDGVKCESAIDGVASLISMGWTRIINIDTAEALCNSDSVRANHSRMITFEARVKHAEEHVIRTGVSNYIHLA